MHLLQGDKLKTLAASATNVNKESLHQTRAASKTAKQIDACFQHKNMTFNFFFLRNNYTSNIQKWSKYCITSILNS
jgi:hypothetical protein